MPAKSGYICVRATPSRWGKKPEIRDMIVPTRKFLKEVFYQ